MYLDLDDVLVDWTGAAIVVAQRHAPLTRAEDESDRQFLARCFSLGLQLQIDLRGPEFWEYLPPMPQADLLLDLVRGLKEKGEIQDWFILTNPSVFKHSYEGKRRWLSKRFGTAHKHILTSNKHLLAKPNTILVDDLPENCALFDLHGGNAHLYPSRDVLYSKSGRYEIRNVAQAIARVAESYESGESRRTFWP